MSKRAAVVKRGAERERRDLFAVRDEEPLSVKQSDAPPPSFGFGGVGARNENSVLFSVAQLSATRLKTPEPAPAPLSERRAGPPDDEGVIDLKALSTTAARPVVMPVAPLFSEPPPVTLEVRGSARPNAPARSRLAFVGAMAAAAVFVVVAGFGIALAFRGEEPVKHTAAVVAPPPPPPAVIVPSADPHPATATAPVAEDDAKETKTKKGKKAKSAGRAGPITNKTPPAAPKTVKPADPCGCHGDFQCILACTAKGGK